MSIISTNIFQTLTRRAGTWNTNRLLSGDGAPRFHRMRSSSFGAKAVSDNQGFMVTLGTTHEEVERADKGDQKKMISEDAPANEALQL